MKKMGISTALVLAALVSGASSTSAADEKKVTITGCVVKGNGDGDGFLLANAVEQTTRTTSTPSATGATLSSTTTTTELKPTRILYWLDDDDDVLDKLMGQQVEVVGEVEGDIERGEIDIERENGMIELEIKADGRKTTVKLPDVPSAVGTSGSVGDREKELDYIVRKLDVKSARGLSTACR
jgi:hypothetical protein